LATARAAASRDHLQILSNVSTTSIEDVIEARCGPVWFRLYPTSDWGLAAFGQPGVEKVLDILSAELAMVMGQMGTPTLKDIGPERLGRHPA